MTPNKTLQATPVTPTDLSGRFWIGGCHKSGVPELLSLGGSAAHIRNQQNNKQIKMKATLLVALLIAPVQFTGYSQGQEQATNAPVQAQGHVKKHGDKPSEYVVGDDSVTFSDVTAPMSAATTNGDLIIHIIVKVTKLKLYTGGFAFTVNGLEPETQWVQPKDGAMFVKVVFDLNSENEDILWKDDIAILSAGGSPFDLFSLMGQPKVEKNSLVVIGFDGLQIRKGGNRIAIIFEGKDQDPTQMHIRIKGRDYGTLASLIK